LSRILEPKSGAIRVAGVDIRRWNRRQLRGLFTTLGQNGAVVFSHQTILETIRFARPTATDAEVLAAARTAAIDAEINRLPAGYHTLLGPGGVRLSKGQLQRLGLAQVVLALKDRPIVVLDEFTSALDSRTEQTVIDNLRPLLQGKTVVIVAHRLATLRKLADRVVVLERGSIVEEGSHRDLVTRNTRYAELARLQSVS
jgi:ATP-binding cassette subfamily B protein